jgi:hypothetical protein
MRATVDLLDRVCICVGINTIERNYLGWDLSFLSFGKPIIYFSPINYIPPGC